MKDWKDILYEECKDDEQTGIFKDNSVVQIKIHNRELIGRDRDGNVLLMDSTGRFNIISAVELYELIKDDRGI